MKKVLFVCTGNTCRSPMAEAIFNKLAKEKACKVRSCSAGLFVENKKVEQNARDALKTMGITIRHKPTKITREMFDSADLVLTMTREQKLLLEREVKSNKLFSIAEFTSGIDISDPYGQNLEKYIDTAKLLEFSIKTIINKMEK